VQVNVLHVTPGTNYFSEFGAVPPPFYPVFDQNNNLVFSFNFNTLDQNDVGKEADIVSMPTQYATNGSPLTVNTGTSEGSTVSIAIQAANTQSLGVNEIVLGDALMNFAAETRLDSALNTITSQRAQVGAQVVALSEAANDASIQYINQTASESSIRDLNVGAATTEFTKQQILTQIGMSVLQQSELSTRQLASLLINALVA
jgi:flagellin-like hook-associated protein FlgL